MLFTRIILFNPHRVPGHGTFMTPAILMGNEAQRGEDTCHRNPARRRWDRNQEGLALKPVLLVTLLQVF